MTGRRTMKRLPVQTHGYTSDRAFHVYSGCRPGVKKVRWHVIYLLLRRDSITNTGRVWTPARVADELGLSVVTVRRILKQWNEHGPTELKDRRSTNRRRPALDAS